MPKPAVRAGTPPAELTDREEGWGTQGRVLDYSDYRDDGVWPAYPADLVPSQQLRHERDNTLIPEQNTSVEDEHPETADGPWFRVTRRVDVDETHGLDEDGNPIQYVHYDREVIGVEGVELDYELDDINTATTFSDYPPEVPPSP